MSKTILGLDLGSNSIGWALLEEKNGSVTKIIDLGSRIFNKAVNEKTPTPKNEKRRQSRLARRVIQRRARRKQKMLNYLVKLDLLPKELIGNMQPEIILNPLGDPYWLRTKALDEQLSPYELGRILLHFSARRGFLSNKKQAAGDLIDDPDTIDYLNEIDNKEDTDETKEEKGFKGDIAAIHSNIKAEGARTLGEYLYRSDNNVKRNRIHEGGHLRTDRAMYKYELEKIWDKQKTYFAYLPHDFMKENKGAKEIIFYQRPIKFKKNSIGKCSLEPTQYRARMSRLEVQRFRYLQDINNIKYYDRHNNKLMSTTNEQKTELIEYFEHHHTITVKRIIKILKLDKSTNINLDTKEIKGNITACKIRAVIGVDEWNELNDSQQKRLFEDLFTIKKKSALKRRLINHWKFNTEKTIKLCLLEFEPSHSNLSLKAINKLLPFLEEGMIYSDARQAADYGYEITKNQTYENLPIPPKTSNPIVNKALHELRRLVNAVIKEYCKPDIIRIEMARDLEMNTKNYQKFIKQQEKNEKANKEAQKEFEQIAGNNKYASRDEKVKYRLWKDQNRCCAYSNTSIPIEQLFTADTEIDHIIPFSKSLDDSYMNKVVCLTKENRDKNNRTPIDAWGENKEKWNQITQSLNKWHKSLNNKKTRFLQTEDTLTKRDFISTQLNDTRYISKLAKEYVCQLGCDVSVTKGYVVSKIRQQWGFNTLIGETNIKDRTDHRHHAIDAVIIAATSRSLYSKAVKQIQNNRFKIAPPYADIRQELNNKLKDIVIAHTPKRKLSGALHEETGAGYIHKHGGLVYRKKLDSEFTETLIEKIIDTTVKNIIIKHISKYVDIKKAFADNIRVYQKNGKTPIKRVRVLQSKITMEKLLKTKLGIKDKTGKIFKWMTYGNTHHLEIFRHLETGEIENEFVSMMEAKKRAMTSTKSAIKRGVIKEKIIKTHKDKHELLAVLHKNDTVSVINQNGKRLFYRVQKFGPRGNTITLRLNTTATLDDDNEKILLTINAKNLEKYKIDFYHVNALGHFINE